MGVRFCLAGAARERRVETEVGRAVLAEELGFDGMFFSEGLMSGLDPFQISAVAATRTKLFTTHRVATEVVVYKYGWGRANLC